MKSIVGVWTNGTGCVRGLASRIISYEERTIELEISISNRWPKDPTTTADPAFKMLAGT